MRRNADFARIPFLIKQKVCTNKHGHFTGPGRKQSTNMACQGFRPSNVPEVSHKTNGSYSMYKATEKGGRSVAAGSGNFSTTPNSLDVDPWISKLPGGVFVSNSRVKILWQLNMERKLYLSNMYQT